MSAPTVAMPLFMLSTQSQSYTQCNSFSFINKHTQGLNYDGSFSLYLMIKYGCVHQYNCPYVLMINNFIAFPNKFPKNSEIIAYCPPPPPFPLLSPPPLLHIISYIKGLRLQKSIKGIYIYKLTIAYFSLFGYTMHASVSILLYFATLSTRIKHNLGLEKPFQ